jgi:hypothetical protein
MQDDTEPLGSKDTPMELRKSVQEVSTDIASLYIERDWKQES